MGFHCVNLGFLGLELGRDTRQTDGRTPAPIL